MRNRALIRKVLRWTLRILGGLVAFVLFLFTGILVALRFAKVQEFAAAQTNAALAGLFKGRIEIQRLGGPTLGGVTGVDARVIDPQGRTVIEARGATIDLFWLGVIWQSLVQRPEVLTIHIERVRLDHVRVHLIDDGKGSPTLVHAFEPATPSPKEEAGGGTEVRIPALELRHAWIHGRLGTGPAIDAELEKLQGSLGSLPDRFELDLGVRLRARALPAAADPTGRLTAKLRLPSAPKARNVVKADFDGVLASAKTTARFGMDGDTISAALDAKDVTAKTFAAIAPSVQPSGPLTLHAEMAGTLPELRFEARADGAGGALALDGTVRAEKTTTIQARLRVRELDARSIVPSAPRTGVSLEATARANIDERGGTTADYRIASSKLQLAGQELPPLRANGDVRVTPASTIDGKGTLEIAEPGATAVVDYRLEQVGTKDGVVAAKARIAVANPARLRTLFAGRGELELDATVRPDRSSVNAAVKGSLARVTASGASVDRLALQGTVEGALENPAIRARVEAAGVAFQDRRFDRVLVDARGTQRALSIDATVHGKKPDRARLTTELQLDPALELRRTQIALQDGRAFEMTVKTDRVALGDRGVQVDGMALEGAGRARGALTWTDRPTRVELSTEGLEVSRILAAFGVDPGVTVRTADIEARYADQRGRPVGSISGVIAGVRIDEVEDGTLRLDVAVANRAVSGTVEAVANGAEVRVTAEEVRIPQAAPTARDLAAIQGKLEATGHVDLARLEPILTQALPLGTASGTIDFNVRLDRARDGARAPRLAARLEASKLRASGRRETVAPIDTAQLARESKPWAIDNLDLSAAAELDAATGLARVDATVKDKKGTLVTARASAKSAPARDFLTLSRQDFTRLPMDVRVAMPPRALEDLPDVIEPKTLRGVLAFDVALEGTVADPNVRAAANLSCVGNVDAKQSIDIALDAEYSREKGRIVANASTDQRQVGSLDARWDGDVTRVGELALDRPSPIRADVSLEMTRFPLDLVPALANEQVRGRLTGNIELEGLGRDARLRGKLESDTLLVGRVGVQKFDFSVDTAGDKLVGKVEIGGNRGVARAEVQAPMTWKDRLVPAIERRIEGRLFADNFRIETIAPLVASQVSELQGRLDADVKAKVTGAAPVVEGTISLQKGVVHLPAIGQRFSNIESKISIDEGDVRLEKFVARGISGKLTVDGRAKLDGVSLQSAEAHLRIAKDDKIPVTVEGASFGDAWGKVDATVKISAKERETAVRVDIPEFQIELPEATPGALQNLEPNDAIRIGTRLPDGGFVTLPVQPLTDEEPSVPSGPASTTRIEVNLGRSVWLKKGQQVQAQLGGRILVEQKATTSITGRIELRGGTLDIQGKRFEIDRGTVTFTGGDPSNPTIIAAARWDSPEGYTVTAEYSGTAQQGKLTLRSEPPLSDNEILSLLMFGTPDGSFGSGSGGSNAETALGVAGGTLTQGFNHMMSNLTDLEVSARIDTSTGSARPELVVQLSPRVTARVTQSFGSPTAGQPPDTTFLTVDFRLRRAWSLSTMVGNRGASALDLIWRKRY